MGAQRGHALCQRGAGPQNERAHFQRHFRGQPEPASGGHATAAQRFPPGTRLFVFTGFAGHHGGPGGVGNDGAVVKLVQPLNI